MLVGFVVLSFRLRGVYTLVYDDKIYT